MVVRVVRSASVLAQLQYWGSCGGTPAAAPDIEGALTVSQAEVECSAGPSPGFGATVHTRARRLTMLPALLPAHHPITTTLCGERFRTNCIMSSNPMGTDLPGEAQSDHCLSSGLAPQSSVYQSLTQPNSSLTTQTFHSNSLDVSSIIIATSCCAVSSLTQWHSPLVGSPRGLCFHRVQRRKKGPVCSSLLPLTNISFLLPKTSPSSLKSWHQKLLFLIAVICRSRSHSLAPFEDSGTRLIVSHGSPAIMLGDFQIHVEDPSPP